MRLKEVRQHKPLEKLAFKFFFKFSRFEFALKENKYLRDPKPGNRASPDWHRFAREHHEFFCMSNQAQTLIESAPKCQIVGSDSQRLDWQDVDLSQYENDLAKVVRLLQTVRNNLFHGGKHGADGWDDPKRTKKLLKLAVHVLDQIAEKTILYADYTGDYG